MNTTVRDHLENVNNKNNHPCYMDKNAIRNITYNKSNKSMQIPLSEVLTTPSHK